STSSPDGWAVSSKRRRSMMWPPRTVSPSGTEAWSRPGWGARRMRPWPRFRGSPCPATSPDRIGSSTRTSPRRSSCTTARSTCPPASASASRSIPRSSSASGRIQWRSCPGSDRFGWGSAWAVTEVLPGGGRGLCLWQRLSTVGVGLLRGILGPVELEGRVLDRDLEVLGQAFLQGLEYPRGMPVIEALVGEDHVGGEHGQVRIDPGDVEIVDFLHVLDGLDVGDDLFEVELLRCRLEQDGARLPKNRESAGHDERRDEQCRHRIGALPPEQPDRQSGEDDCHGSQGIGDHLEESGPEVERVLLRRTQDGDRDEVADQADSTEDEQSRARHLGRHEEAADAFDETVDAEPEQQGRLSPGRQNLSAPEPPGLLTAGRFVDECRRKECDADADEVDSVVAGVDEQREAAGDDGADELEDEDRGDDGEHDGQLPPRPRTMRMIMSHDCLLTRSY